MADEHAEPERAVEDVDDGFDVEVVAELTLLDAVADRFGSVTIFGEEPVAEPVGYGGVALGVGDKFSNDRADRRGEYPRHMLHLASDVVVGRPGVGKRTCCLDAPFEGVENQRTLGGPPPVDRLLGYTGMLGDLVDGDLVGSVGAYQFSGSVEDSLLHLGVALGASFSHLDNLAAISGRMGLAETGDRRS